jgi:hypothetical protein
MKIYLDDDCASHLLMQMLREAEHDVRIPSEARLGGEHDAVHFRHAIRDGRVILTRNYEDFEELHELVLDAGGHHPGILIIRKDREARRNLKPRAIVHAIENLLASETTIKDRYVILNHWR